LSGAIPAPATPFAFREGKREDEQKPGRTAAREGGSVPWNDCRHQPFSVIPAEAGIHHRRCILHAIQTEPFTMDPDFHRGDGNGDERGKEEA
jgi:hypothetical protein